MVRILFVEQDGSKKPLSKDMFSSLIEMRIVRGMTNVIWQLPVKQSNVTNHDWVHPKSKYHAFASDKSLCGKYSQATEFFETTIESSELMINKENACKECLKKLN